MDVNLAVRSVLRPLSTRKAAGSSCCSAAWLAFAVAGWPCRYDGRRCAAGGNCIHNAGASASGDPVRGRAASNARDEGALPGRQYSTMPRASGVESTWRCGGDPTRVQRARVGQPPEQWLRYECLMLSEMLPDQAPEGDPSELDAAELRSVRLFQRNTPSVVNIANISERSHDVVCLLRNEAHSLVGLAGRCLCRMLSARARR